MSATQSPAASENGASIPSAPTPSIKESLNGTASAAQAPGSENGVVAGTAKADGGPLATPPAAP